MDQRTHAFLAYALVNEQMKRRSKGLREMQYDPYYQAETKLRKAPQPPLSHPGAPAEADRAKSPPLVQPSSPDPELNPGDRVEGLGNFGTPTGEFGTVEEANEDDAIVKWDDDGRVRLHQPWLKKV